MEKARIRHVQVHSAEEIPKRLSISVASKNIVRKKKKVLDASKKQQIMAKGDNCWAYARANDLSKLKTCKIDVDESGAFGENILHFAILFQSNESAI